MEIHLSFLLMLNYNIHIVDKRKSRKLHILGHIVHEYVSTGVPVSSKVVAEMMGGSISSATIRNIMAELEEEGYIIQPHTSAGRIPTRFGYRCYVDMAKDQIRLKKDEANRLASEYDRRMRTIEELIEKTSFLISRELHNAGIVMWPSVEDFYLKHVQLLKVQAETILAVLVTMTNDVRKYIIKLDRDLEKSELEVISNYINSNYEYEAFSQISEELRQVLSDPQRREDRGVIEVARLALNIMDSIIDRKIGNEIYWEGLDYFMEKAESQNADLTRYLFRIFAHREDLARIMSRELPDRGLRIYIGEENDCDMLSECSLITCGYTLRDRTVGRLGVIGPTRMDYDHALRTVKCLSDLISLKLTEING